VADTIQVGLDRGRGSHDPHVDTERDHELLSVGASTAGATPGSHEETLTVNDVPAAAATSRFGIATGDETDSVNADETDMTNALQNLLLLGTDVSVEHLAAGSYKINFTAASPTSSRSTRRSFPLLIDGGAHASARTRAATTSSTSRPSTRRRFVKGGDEAGLVHVLVVHRRGLASRQRRRGRRDPFHAVPRDAALGRDDGDARRAGLGQRAASTSA